VIATLLLLSSIAAAGTVPHPRLYARPDDWLAIKQRIAESHGDLAARYRRLVDQAKKDFLPHPDASGATLPPTKLEYTFTSDDSKPTIRPQAKLIIKRVSALAGLLRLAPARALAEVRRDPMFLQARDDLMTVTGPAFPNWNPPEFLDTAEMTRGVAIGYDWLHEWLTPEERATIRSGLVTKGLQPGLEGIRKPESWAKATNNWAQVTRGGLVAGALAVEEDEPALAAALLEEARVKLAEVGRAYAPDGGFPEGQGYYNYATSYFVTYLATLKSAHGEDSALRALPGFAESGLFDIHTVGPIDDPERLSIQTFDFADDSGADAGDAHLFWMAREFRRPEYAAKELRRLSVRPWTVTIFHLLWYPSDETAPELPLDHVFQGVRVATFRSAWNDPNALFVGFKGGAPGKDEGHSHLDHGTFVLDWGGVRWGLDYGRDVYALPGYFDRKSGARWKYYRLNTHGHNTLTVDDRDQDPAADAPLAFDSEARIAIADLSHDFPDALTELKRGIRILGKSQLLVQDELASKGRHAVVWHLHTPASVALSGASATLTQGKRKLVARILSPASAKFAQLPVNPTQPPGQNPNDGTTDLAIELSVDGSERITVLFAPEGEASLAPPLASLSRWAK
jgi:hypothetical protein